MNSNIQRIFKSKGSGDLKTVLNILKALMMMGAQILYGFALEMSS